MKTFVFVICMLVLAGCTSVLLKEPFPETKLTEKEQNMLTGVFEADPTLHLNFTSNGVPWLATIEWKNDDYRINKHRVNFTRRGDALYISMPDEPDSGEYFFAEIKPGHQEIYVWIPDADFFKPLVQAGKLKGSIGKGEVVLDTPAAEILELIATNPAAINYKEPLRIPKID